jgi:hypothetical protein|tara:strand:- start:5150 stop:5335 length:186 start_codon:yes stop_codon:yes gene_type:complete
LKVLKSAKQEKYPRQKDAKKTDELGVVNAKGMVVAGLNERERSVGDSTSASNNEGESPSLH